MTTETISSAMPKASSPIYTSLFFQVVVALVLGIILGVATPNFAIQLKILSDAFLKLITMIVAPIVFSVVVHGIASAKGAHGIPGSAIVILAATLNAVPAIPAIGLVLVLSIDWFIGMARAVGNLIGNCVATVVIAAWEGDLDYAKARQVLDEPELVDVTAG